MHLLSTLLVVAPVLVAAQNCPLQFDGRVPKGAKLELLDTKESPFNADYVKGAGEFWGVSFLFYFGVVRREGERGRRRWGLGCTIAPAGSDATIEAEGERTSRFRS